MMLTLDDASSLRAVVAALVPRGEYASAGPDEQPRSRSTELRFGYLETIARPGRSCGVPRVAEAKRMAR